MGGRLTCRAPYSRWLKMLWPEVSNMYISTCVAVSGMLTVFMQKSTPTVIT